MKYPQLVSPRAVNAISDWLVSRLEQLGVESPQIYTRLLLSLLQSSVQVNDPIEFSNLEAFFTNRKGGHKRFYLPSDTETLKKLNAVQCLREIVSNEQETATIEQLVEELCEKLKDIEKQTQNLRDEDRFLIETNTNTDSLLQTQTQTNTQLQHHPHPTSSNNNTHQHTRHHQQHHYHHQYQQQEQQVAHICNKSDSATLNADSKRHHVLSTLSIASDTLNDLDNDPKKRYFRAFPALSKEMEDSFRIWRRNAKSLTWPVVGRSIVVDNLNNSPASSSSTSSAISSSNFGSSSAPTDKNIEKKLKCVVGQLENKVTADTPGSGCSEYIGGSDVKQQHQVAVGASAKKKSKRRRNQALCKGKTIQNLRKLSVSAASNSVGGNKYHQYTHQRNTSPAWDTDFKGCWEMGPDLIKEFLSRQNSKKRNRSNSDSMEHEDQNEHVILNEKPAENDKKPIVKSYIDLSFCYDDDDDEFNDYDGDSQNHCSEQEAVEYFDEDYDDNTLASVPELTTDNFNPKRLYQREGHLQKNLQFGGNLLINNSTLEEMGDSVDPLDFQQFKAKFNSSVEALWKDAEPSPRINLQKSSIATQNAETLLKLPHPQDGGISSAFYASTSLNALAPFKKDLWNFWSNYQQQNLDHLNNKLSTTASTSSMITITGLDESSASSGAGADIGNSSDYFSMPSNLNDFDKSVGSVRRTNDGSLGAHTPSINVFLQNSIWSTSGDCVEAIGTSSAATAADTDESFLFKVWHSNKKLSQLDVGNAVNYEKMLTIVTENDGVNDADLNKSKETSSIMVNNSNLGANIQFPPYQNLKWSEGINAGPPYGSLCAPDKISHHNEMQSLNSNSSMLTDNNYSSFTSVASLSGATWEAPVCGQNAQPDLKSWCASNPISLTEMYGNDVCDSIVNQPPEEEHILNPSEMAVGPAVTLPNHCPTTSGFVAYSRIKTCGIEQAQSKPAQTSNGARLPKDFFRSSEEENLLNSESTHFHPIENFINGHTFNISNALETIEFERTSSGLMRYESEEYLEYTRSDIYMADEEVATSSTNLLKYSRNSNEDKDEKDMFIIKFRVKRCGDIGCQTEEEDFHLTSDILPEIPTSFAAFRTFPPNVEVNNMFCNTFSLSRQANNEAIMAAVTKAVAAAAKAAAENHLNAGHFCWMPIKNVNTNTIENPNNSGENNPLWRSDDNICDEVDFCETDSSEKGQQQQLSQNWSMQEIERQCYQRRCLPHHLEQQQNEIEKKFRTKADIERSEENSLDNTSLHTLWGMCAVCHNCEFGKSMPANRLLKDELQIEADEIMSDLRYMQDLYIGETEILSDTNATKENDIATDDRMFDYFNREMNRNSMKNPWNIIDIKENIGQQHDPSQVSMLQKVNQLIEDLLKTENAEKLPRESLVCNESIKQVQLANARNFETHQDETNNLWQFSEQEDNNIWQHKPFIERFEGETSKKNEAFVKPIELLKKVGGSISEDLQYRKTINWEHDNLAKIWQHSMSTSTPPEEALLEQTQTKIANNVIDKQLLKEQEESSEGSQKLVEEKNLKNLENSNVLTPPSSTFQCSTYKKVQQLLNNSGAKMKLISNRKRRHSASQNFYQQHHFQYDISSINNNNNNNITDLNAYKEQSNGIHKTAKDQQRHQQEVAPLNITSTSNLNSEEQPTKQTIITCKYWTAATNGTQSSLDSAAMMLLAAATNANNANDMLTATATDNFEQEDVIQDENIFGNTFSCLIDKNASILKHVTMMTRPLTR